MTKQHSKLVYNTAFYFSIIALTVTGSGLILKSNILKDILKFSTDTLITYATQATITANPDTATTDSNTGINISALTNDTSTDTGSVLNYCSSSLSLEDPASGSFSIIGNAVRFIPASNFVGISKIFYKACDVNFTESNFSYIEINVTAPVNIPPVANNDSYMISDIRLQYPLNIITNDTDTDGILNFNSLNITTYPTKGTIVIDSVNKVVLYKPDKTLAVQSNIGLAPIATFQDSFSYRVNDDDGASSNIANVNLSFDYSNSGPVLQSQVINARAGETAVFALANITDAENDIPYSMSIIQYSSGIDSCSISASNILSCVLKPNITSQFETIDLIPRDYFNFAGAQVQFRINILANNTNSSTSSTNSSSSSSSITTNSNNSSSSTNSTSSKSSTNSTTTTNNLLIRSGSTSLNFFYAMVVSAFAFPFIIKISRILLKK